MNSIRRAINAPLFLIAFFALVLAALHPQQTAPGPRYPELLQARDLLVNYDIDSPDGNELMHSAWDAALEFAQRRGVSLKKVFVPDPGRPTNTYESLFLRLLSASEGIVKRGDLIEVAITAMADSLHDGHTGYIPAEAWKYESNQADTFIPLFLYRSTFSDRGKVVWDVEPGSQAERSGLHVGDTILAVNGVSVFSKGESDLKAVNKFQVMRRDGSKAALKIKVEGFSMHPFEARMIGDIAYFQLYGFPPLSWHLGADSLLDNLRAAFSYLKSYSPSGWILDLRGNSGGFFDTGAWIASALGASGPLEQQTSRQGPRKPIVADDDSYVGKAPVAVLIDGTSASASEILAFVLRESAGARLFGTKTKAVVRGAQRAPLDRGGGLSISTSNVQAGRSKTILEKVGVEPDDVVQLTPERVLERRDDPLDRAIDWLHDKNPSPLH